MGTVKVNVDDSDVFLSSITTCSFLPTPIMNTLPPNCADYRQYDLLLVRFYSASIVFTHVDGSVYAALNTRTFKSKLDRPFSSCFDLLSGLF